MKRSKRILSLCLILLLALGLFACGRAPETTPVEYTGTKTFKNVIFMIGDGMGANHLRLAEQEGYDLFMEKNADLHGWSRTRSADKEVTDSAAGATALSCGLRVKNGQVAVFPDGRSKSSRPRTVAEHAKLLGMRVGVVTSDKTRGATPAAFSAHNKTRDAAGEISQDQLASGFDLIWGESTSTVSAGDAEAHGFVHVANVEEMNALQPGTRSFGQFGSDAWSLTPENGTPTLLQMTEKALSLLCGAEKGFFLMVEGAHIDKFADDADEDGNADYPDKRAKTAECVAAFDLAVRAAVEFAEKDGNTLVIVTADHETGDLYKEEATGEYTFHTTSHTGKDVPVFVYGAPDLFPEGEAIDNASITNLVAGALGWTERFPIADPKTAALDPAA